MTGRANGSTIDANSSGRVFYISGAGAAVSINNLTISGGSLSSGSGGGIYASRNASVSLSNSTVSGNWGGRSGGAISINNTSTLSMSNSTVSGNSATSSGGAIFIANYSTLSLSNSTVSGNSARTGGAIRLAATSTLSLSNSTVSDNSADYYGGISASVGNNTVSLNNNIFSGNRGSVCAEICASNTIFTTAHNLFGDSVNYNSDAFSGFTPDTTDITATSNGSQPTALSRILAPLANNGGGTQTHALVAGSPAIDSGNNALCAAEPINNLDQRGAPRPVGNACDIGAYEGMGVSSRTKADSSMAKDDSSFFVVPLPNGKVVVFEL
ncbi:MAG: putative outer membrane repeat protein [Arenicella sp.]